MLLDLPPVVLVLAAGVLGLCVGSFLNVVIHRLPQMMEREWQAQCAELRGEPPTEAAPFNLLLPLAGLVSAILSLIWLAVLVGWQGGEANLDALIPAVVTQAALLVASLLLWFSPLYLQRDTAPVVVSTSLCGLLIAQIAATSVLHQLI